MTRGERAVRAPDAGLSRREREIMRILYRLGEGTVRDVVREMSDGPGYNAVRVTLGILERKGRVVHREDGRRYVYRPVVEREQASRRALREVVGTFFQDDPSRAVMTMLDDASTRLSDDELREIEAWIRKNREERDDG